jgi:glycosyltransferase involved in cell wall biosynthesis
MFRSADLNSPISQSQAHPKISIVTPSFNQGRYIRAAIESVLTQSYRNVEHIVIDGGSTDETLSVLADYHHLKVVSEPDQGQWDAINKGFALATGDIWGFLNSDDTLLPGALERVAQEIDPERGRHIIMGRCQFVDEQGRFVGIEHPSHFVSHKRVLEVWKGHSIPQPAVFWTPEVWKTCGPMRDIQYHLDYDLFCRFSRRYRFHFVDQILATYRLRPGSKTGGMDEEHRLEHSISLSREYWGTPFRPFYWQMRTSLALHQFGRRRRTYSLLTKARDAFRRRDLGAAFGCGLLGFLLGPDVALEAIIVPLTRDGAQNLGQRLLLNLAARRGHYRETAAFRGYTDVWDDGWAGPEVIVRRTVSASSRELVVAGWTDVRYMGRSLDLTFDVDGRPLGTHRIDTTGEFEVRFPWQNTQHNTVGIRVRANKWFVPHRFSGTGDFRPLAWRIKRLDFE